MLLENGVVWGKSQTFGIRGTQSVECIEISFSSSWNVVNEKKDSRSLVYFPWAIMA